MPLPVTDARSNPSDQVAHAARVLGRSKHRQAIFEAVCRGRATAKSVTQLVRETKIKRQQVLNAAKHLVDNQIIAQTTRDGEVAYQKDSFLASNRTRILALARNPVRLRDFPTKTRPEVLPSTLTLRLPKRLVDVQRVMVDDIDSFSRIKRVKEHERTASALAETVFKRGVQALVGEPGEFKDWGGERNDLWTTRLRLGGRRRAAAMAFKGRATTGKLTPKKMGTNGDQIQRLFTTAADVFLVQYWGQIDESVSEQMQAFAIARSATRGTRVWFGVIDGSDTARLIAAYPKAFGSETGRRG